jgi:hypothetical protein
VASRSAARTGCSPTPMPAAAAMYSLIESAKLSGLDPQFYLADLLTRKSPTTRPGISPIFFPGTGGPPSPIALPRKRWRLHRALTVQQRAEALQHANTVGHFGVGLALSGTLRAGSAGAAASGGILA